MRVVLVRLSALGDIVHTWPLAEALKTRRSDLHLTWVVEQPFLPLVAGHPAVDETVTVATRSWRRRPLAAATRREISSLRQRFRELAPDVAIDSQGVLKSALVTWWTGAPRRYGLARPWRREAPPGLAYTDTLRGSSEHPHVVATNMALAEAVGSAAGGPPPAPDGRWLLDRPADGAPSHEGPPTAVLLPGAGHRSKILPAATLRSVARQLADRGLAVVVAWGPGEEVRARAVVADSPASLAPPTDIPALANLLAGASLVVGGDTGPVHLAASLRVPTVAIHLSTSEARNGPLGEQVAVVSGTAASPARPTGSAHARSVRTVTAEEIVAAAVRLCGGQGSGRNHGLC